MSVNHFWWNVLGLAQSMGQDLVSTDSFLVHTGQVITT